MATYVRVYIWNDGTENVGTWGPPQSLERGGQTRTRKQKRRQREGATANGRDNPSRSLPRSPLIKSGPVNWGG